MTQPSHADLSVQIAKILTRVDALTEVVTELKTDVSELKALRNQGVGFIAAITLTGALLMLGLKSWIEGLIAGMK